MKNLKTTFYIALIIFGFILTGCPYEGEVELKTFEPVSKNDKNLFDHWVSYGKEGGRHEILISKLNKSVLEVRHKVINKKNQVESRKRYEAQLCSIKGSDVFNLKTDDGKYFYCKYDWTGKNEIFIQYIDESFVNSNFKNKTINTKTLTAFISENLTNEALYSEKIEFYRYDSPEHEKVKIFMRKSGF